MGLPDFSQKVLVEGTTYGTTPPALYPVAVDSQGRLVALMHGKYGATIAPVSLDDAGRMEAVIVEAGDPTGTYPAVGLIELANRLGGGYQWDPRGRILWTYDFEHGLPAKSELFAGPNDVVQLSAELPLQGGYCLFISLYDAPFGYVEMSRYTAPKTPSRFGLEMAFALWTDTIALGFALTGRVGGYYFDAGIEVDTSDYTLYYIDEMGNAVPFQSDIQVNTTGLAYDKIKFVVDSTTGTYVRVILNDNEWDATSCSMTWYPDTGPSFLQPWFYAVNLGMGWRNLFLDNIVLTHMEPPNE